MDAVKPAPDLFAALEPPKEEAERPKGLIDGPPGWHEGFGAGLRCWCGPVVGWRPLGEVIGGPDCERVVVFQHGRLAVGITFDLGPHKRPRRVEDDRADDH